MNELNVESAQYQLDPIDKVATQVVIFVNGQRIVVPMNPANRHYAEIMRQVEAGELVIQDAES